MDGSAFRNIGLVGQGTQGPMIAFRCALAGKHPYIYDVLPGRLDEAGQKIRQWLRERVSQGRLTEEEAEAALGRVHVCRTLADCVADADLVIEVVSEKLDLKRRVWAEIDSLAPAKTILSSNTSSFRLSEMYVDVKRKDRTYTQNFQLPLEDDVVEVMWGPETSEDTRRAAKTFLKSIGMIVLETKKENKGYSWNRTWRAIKKEVLRLVDQGYSDVDDLDRAFMLVLGCKMGPFQIMDYAGLDVIRDVEISYYEDSGDPSDKPPKILEDLVAKGHYGVKTGKGFYTYPNPDFERPGWLYKQGEFEDN